eukprot:2413032-Prymnesium_polylepis.1
MWLIPIHPEGVCCHACSAPIPQAAAIGGELQISPTTTGILCMACSAFCNDMVVKDDHIDFEKIAVAQIVHSSRIMITKAGLSKDLASMSSKLTAANEEADAKKKTYESMAAELHTCRQHLMSTKAELAELKKEMKKEKRTKTKLESDEIGRLNAVICKLHAEATRVEENDIASRACRSIHTKIALA